MKKSNKLVFPILFVGLVIGFVGGVIFSLGYNHPNNGNLYDERQTVIHVLSNPDYKYTVSGYYQIGTQLKETIGFDGSVCRKIYGNDITCFINSVNLEKDYIECYCWKTR